MLDKDKLSKDIKDLSLIIGEIDVALSVETDLQINVALRNARGNLRTSVAWLAELYTDLFGEIHELRRR